MSLVQESLIKVECPTCGKYVGKQAYENRHKDSITCYRNVQELIPKQSRRERIINEFTNR